jgi:hypothetical protein
LVDSFRGRRARPVILIVRRLPRDGTIMRIRQSRVLFPNLSALIGRVYDLLGQGYDLTFERLVGTRSGCLLSSLASLAVSIFIIVGGIKTVLDGEYIYRRVVWVHDWRAVALGVLYVIIGIGWLLLSFVALCLVVGFLWDLPKTSELSEDESSSGQCPRKRYRLRRARGVIRRS